LYFAYEGKSVVILGRLQLVALRYETVNPSKEVDYFDCKLHNADSLKIMLTCFGGDEISCGYYTQKCLSYAVSLEKGLV